MIKNILILLIIFIIISCQSISSIISKKDNGIFDGLENYIEYLIEENNLNGIQIAITDDNQTIWSGNFGYSDKKNKEIVMDNTVFRYGSVSKVFTAIAVMQLVEKGLINLDEDIRSYIDDLDFADNGFKNKVSIRSLLTHNSGLISDRMFNKFSDEEYDFRNIVSLINQTGRIKESNFNYQYSNAGFALLGVLIERVSQKDFYQYMKDNIFIPLEMNNSSFKKTDILKEDTAKAHFSFFSIEEPLVFDTPAGSLTTTAVDMQKFIRMILNGGIYNDKRIINKETLDLMMQNQLIDNEFDFNHKAGLAWFIEQNRLFGKDILQISHGGGTISFISLLSIHPDLNIGWSISSNTQNSLSSVNNIDKRIQFYLKKYYNQKDDQHKTRPILTDNKQYNFIQEGITGVYNRTNSLLEIIGQTDNGYRGSVTIFNNKDFSKKPGNNSFIRAEIELTANSEGLFILKPIGKSPGIFTEVIGIIEKNDKKYLIKKTNGTFLFDGELIRTYNLLNNKGKSASIEHIKTYTKIGIENKLRDFLPIFDNAEITFFFYNDIPVMYLRYGFMRNFKFFMIEVERDKTYKIGGFADRLSQHILDFYMEGDTEHAFFNGLTATH